MTERGPIADMGDLRVAVERTHGGYRYYDTSVPVREVFHGKPYGMAWCACLRS
jgi:hypothetical protein